MIPKKLFLLTNLLGIIETALWLRKIFAASNLGNKCMINSVSKMMMKKTITNMRMKKIGTKPTTTLELSATSAMGKSETLFTCDLVNWMPHASDMGSS